MVLEIDVDLYAYFGLTLDSSTKEIKRAYKRKAKELHPDKNKDDSKAKENFQMLKEYYDILLDPLKKNQYDHKIKAKIAAAKRHSELDGERRRLRDILEEREKEAANRRKEANVMYQKEKVADRIRKDWEAKTEAAAYAARQENIKRKEAMKKRNNPSTAFVITVKWKQKNNSQEYDTTSIHTCLREFGNPLNVVVGKKGSAIAEFATRKEADDAINAASLGRVGYSDNNLKISWVGGVAPLDAQPDNIPEPPTDVPFESFETDILSKMARFA